MTALLTSRPYLSSFQHELAPPTEAPKTAFAVSMPALAPNGTVVGERTKRRQSFDRDQAANDA